MQMFSTVLSIAGSCATIRALEGGAARSFEAFIRISMAVSPSKGFRPERNS